MTTIPAEPKKRHRLTQADCDTAKYLMEHRQTLQEIGKIIGVDSSTIGKIRLADYNLEKYLAKRRAMNEKTRAKKRNKPALNAFMEPEAEKNDKQILQQLVREAAGGITKGVEQVARQNKMDCNQLSFEEYLRMNDFKEPEDPDIQKLMRLIAKMSDKIVKKLDELIDVLQKGGEAHE